MMWENWKVVVGNRELTLPARRNLENHRRTQSSSIMHRLSHKTVMLLALFALSFVPAQVAAQAPRKAPSAARKAPVAPQASSLKPQASPQASLPVAAGNRKAQILASERWRKVMVEFE